MQDKKNNPIIFRPGPGLRDRLMVIADAQGMTISQVVRAACENYVANEPSPRVPVVGTITGGPEDAALWDAIKKVFQANFGDNEIGRAA